MRHDREQAAQAFAERRELDASAGFLVRVAIQRGRSRRVRAVQRAVLFELADLSLDGLTNQTAQRQPDRQCVVAGCVVQDARVDGAFRVE